MSNALGQAKATHSAPVQIHFSPCHILVLISRTSSPLPNNRSHPAGPSIGPRCQHLKVIIPNLWHPGVYSYIMMGKTTCPQRQRTFLRCLPICFGGAAHFGPNSEWQAGRFFFFLFFFWGNFYFLPLEQASLGVIIWGDKANPIGSGSPPHSAGGTSSPCLTARPWLCKWWLFVCPREGGLGD